MRYPGELPTHPGVNSMRVSLVPAPKAGVLFENPTYLDRTFEILLTKKQLAERLALSPSFINLLMAKEGLPHFKIGRAVRFRVREVVAWLQKRSQP